MNEPLMPGSLHGQSARLARAEGPRKQLRRTRLCQRGDTTRHLAGRETSQEEAPQIGWRAPPPSAKNRRHSKTNLPILGWRRNWKGVRRGRGLSGRSRPPESADRISRASGSSTKKQSTRRREPEHIRHHDQRKGPRRASDEHAAAAQRLPVRRREASAARRHVRTEAPGAGPRLPRGGPAESDRGPRCGREARRGAATHLRVSAPRGFAQGGLQRASPDRSTAMTHHRRPRVRARALAPSACAPLRAAVLLRARSIIYSRPDGPHEPAAAMTAQRRHTVPANQCATNGQKPATGPPGTPRAPQWSAETKSTSPV
ncbi:hypothetical protein HPB47_000508 [Ixodes persulcatus]|uniref:Uncharacterized protein n=1 Tax=Ixodes persulcatus TaxID=34615 RepID=A0AC60PRJ8_IXOPE|nr:hypothetical protein HPB47_000508 [Ixodes persulcatus]